MLGSDLDATGDRADGAAPVARLSGLRDMLETLSGLRALRASLTPSAAEDAQKNAQARAALQASLDDLNSRAEKLRWELRVKDLAFCPSVEQVREQLAQMMRTKNPTSCILHETSGWCEIDRSLPRVVRHGALRTYFEPTENGGHHVTERCENGAFRPMINDPNKE